MHGLKGVVAQLNESTLTKEALIMISIKGLKYGTPEALDLIKQASISFGQHKKRYKKVPAVQEKETSTQTLVSGTQTGILHVEPSPKLIQTNVWIPSLHQTNILSQT